jgi:GntR family transcriptional regulator
MVEDAVPLPATLSRDRAKGTQLEEILEGLVVRLGPGGRLPSERQLAERFDIARMTVRGAIDGLIARGLLYRAQGQGTFVAQPRFAQSEALTSFSEDMRRRGLRPGATVLGRDVVGADPGIAGRLEIAEGDPVVRFERLRTADGEPMALERAHLPLARFPGLDALDLTDTSLYDALRSNWDVAIHNAEQRVHAVLLEGRDAARLDVEPGQPALAFHRLTRDAAGLVIEYVVSLYRGDRYEVRTHLHRGAFSAAEPPARRED